MISLLQAVDMISALKEVALEALKILGPAAIAAFLSLRLANAQARQRIEELRHQFEEDVRTRRYDLLVGQESKIEAAFAGSQQAIMQIVGFLAGISSDLTSPEVQSVARTTAETVRRMSLLAITESRLVLREMENRALTDTEEYRIAKDAMAQSSQHVDDSIVHTRSAAFDLLAIHSALKSCNRRIVHGQLDTLLKPHSIG